MNRLRDEFWYTNLHQKLYELETGKIPERQSLHFFLTDTIQNQTKKSTTAKKCFQPVLFI